MSNSDQIADDLRRQREQLMEEANALTEGIGHTLRSLTPAEKERLYEILDRVAHLLDEIRRLESSGRP